MTYVYIARQPRAHYVKIGVANDPHKRTRELGLELLCAIERPDRAEALTLERGLHRMFVRAPHGGEWFEPAPYLLAIADDPSLETWRA